jgi:predicted ATPase/class 3 adenylate cyclase
MSSSTQSRSDPDALLAGATLTLLFTDIEGSTRLWEREPERMRIALARHDALARAAVLQHGGVGFKSSGDGISAAFEDPLGALGAALQLQLALGDAQATHGIELRVRCGVHTGACERRDNDFFGPPVNRAARIMGAAHGGQILVSEAVASLIRNALPAGVTLRDLGSARLRDLASPERLYQVGHPQLPSDFPPLRSLELTPNNLPQQVTGFIGREHELAEVRRLLHGTRLLTFVGAGGIGKTRLSLQAAADAMDAFADGVWIVELAALTDAHGVPQAVASVLGVKEERDLPLMEALLKHLRSRTLLIVLDNCEHLLQACADLASQLLQAAPNVKMIATSRERLRTAGEQVFPLPTLSIPQATGAPDAESLMQFESARLFIDRACAAQPAFKASAANAAAIVSICVQLDGIALALELAAARVRALPVETLAARLDDRFRLLGGGDRASSPRQQTLRALIDWSFDLLSETERAVLRRLAVFAGGFTLEAAEAVVAGGDLAEGDVVDPMTSLVEKSLVTMEASGNRYRLLETVRQYARQRLDQSGDGSRARDRHLAFYLAFAESARPQLIGPDQGIWLARLDLERENVLAAHAWAGEAQGSGEAGLKLSSALRRYWVLRGFMGMGHRITLEALSRPDAQAPSPARCEALLDAGQLCGWMGRYQEAQAHLEGSLALARANGDPRLVARALQPLGLALLGQGNFAQARRHFEDGLELARQQGNKRELAAALNALAQLNRTQGELDQAEQRYRDVLALGRELDDPESIAIALLNLAMVSIAHGERDRSRPMLREVASIAVTSGSKPLGQSLLDVCAGLAALCSESVRAARFYGAAQGQAEQTGLQRDPADETFLAPLMAQVHQALGPGVSAAAEAAGRAMDYGEAIGQASQWLAKDA